MEYYRRVIKVVEARELSFSNYDIKNMKHNFYKNNEMPRKSDNTFDELLNNEVDKLKSNRTI